MTALLFKKLHQIYTEITHTAYRIEAWDESGSENLGHDSSDGDLVVLAKNKEEAIEIGKQFLEAEEGIEVNAYELTFVTKDHPNL